MIARGRVLLSKIRGLFAGARHEREFGEELEAHLDLLAQKFVREGLSPEDARRAARRQFGNLTLLRQSRREMASFAPLKTFLQDVRYGARGLARSPGWTAVAVLTLTLGIGANVAIFSVVRPVLLDPLPYPQANRLVVPRTIFLRDNTDRGSVSFADAMDWRNARTIFERVSVYNPSSADLTGGEEPERVSAAVVDDEYFRVMGSPPLLGRFFTAEENLRNGPNAVVLSHALWTRLFAQDRSVVGTRIEVRGVPHTIVGVTRPDSTWPVEAQIFLPIGTGGTPTPDMLRRDNHVYQVIARLQPGVSVDRAQAQLTVMGAAVARQATNRAQTNWKLHTLSSYIVGPVLQQTLVVLFGAVVVVLLIACVNVANLLLVRGAGREREVAIRSALGASWKRIAAQFLAETALLSAAGGLAGIAVGYWGLKALVRLAPPDIPRLDNAHIDAGVVLFALLLCVATTILAGLAPAWHAARVAPGRSFEAAGRSASQSVRTGRLRSALVVAELALAIVLLTGAGLLVRSFAHIQRVDAGVATRNMVTLDTSLPGSRYPGAQVAAAFATVTEAIRRVPGVISATAATSLPLGGGGFYLGRVHLREGQPEPPASRDTAGQWCGVQPGYFATLGIPLLDGRDFTSFDTASSAPVVIISRSMAREMFPEGGAVGRRIRSWRDENKYREIIGVVGDVLAFGLTEERTNNVYVPHSQAPARSMALLVRTSGDAGAAVGSIRNAIRSVDRKLPVARVRTLEQIVDQNLARPRFSMFLLGMFGLAALALAAIGIYGVIAYTVGQRTREIGIRMAMGAARARVVSMVARDAIRLAAVGVAGGLAGAFLVTRLIKTLLFNVSPTDPWTFAGAALVLLLVALVAAMVPARRASLVDPATTLRCE